MIDRELVTRKLVLIAEDLPAVERLAARPRDEYLASPTDELVAERYLERIIGRMIDVNYHLLTESGQPPPRDYFQSFVDLAALGVLDSAFARRIAAAAGLRNRLAHEYDEIDPVKVHETLGGVVADVTEYLDRIRTALDRESG